MKRSQNSGKIDEKSMLGWFGGPRSFRGRGRTRSGRLVDVQMAPQARSGDAPGGPRVARSRPKASPGCPRDAPRASRRPLGTSFSRDLGEQACRKARKANFVRFFGLRVLSRDCSDVHETSFLMVFQQHRSMFASHERAHAGASKKQPFRPQKTSLGAPKSLPGASGRPKIEPKRPSSSDKARSKCLWGLRKFMSEREPGNFERESASSAPDERAEARRLRGEISESSNGFL